MSTQPVNSYVTPQEYLAAEREVETKSEHIDGVVYAMTGDHINHIRIVTKAFDRGAKFLAYQQLDSLQEYRLVALDKPAVEQFVRQTDGTWNYGAVIGRESSLSLPSVACALNLNSIYDKVDWEQFYERTT